METKEHLSSIFNMFYKDRERERVQAPVCVCVYLVVWQEVVRQVSLLSQGVADRLEVALLHHVEGLRRQERHAAGWDDGGDYPGQFVPNAEHKLEMLRRNYRG